MKNLRWLAAVAVSLIAWVEPAVATRFSSIADALARWDNKDRQQHMVSTPWGDVTAKRGHGDAPYVVGPKGSIGGDHIDFLPALRKGGGWDPQDDHRIAQDLLD